MSQPTLDHIEAGAMHALTVPEPGTVPDSVAVTRDLAQCVVDLVQYLRSQEGKPAVAA